MTKVLLLGQSKGAKAFTDSYEKIYGENTKIFVYMGNYKPKPLKLFVSISNK